MLPTGRSKSQLHGGHGHHGTGYLARPRLGTVRGVYSTKPLSTRPGGGFLSGVGSARKMKYRKSAPSKLDSYKKRPDPVDTAYREAVGRLKVLLAESYTVPIVAKRHLRDDSGDDTDNQSLLSSRSRHSHHHYHRSSPFIARRYPFYSTTPGLGNKYEKRDEYKAPETERKDVTSDKWEEKQPAPEMMTFIQRQEDYIEQLEREAQFCRDELSGLLGKVKEVISENENLHERQKSNLIKSVFDHLETETETDAELEHLKSPRKSPKKSKRLEGPSIVFESRISELEAQLTQTKIELKKCQEENENYKRKIADGTIGDLSYFDSYKMQIENTQREKNQLQEQITKLNYELAALKERNNDTTHKIKRSLDVVEQAQFEKTQLESEIRRLKDELDRQHDKLRETIHEQGRRITDERAAVERRYTQQIEQLTAELGIQWETSSKLQLELDKQRREDTDVKREVAQKQAHIDELRKEMQTKTAALQSDLAACGAERGALEQQVAALNLAVERAERHGKAETARLQAEVQSLRQRLDRADADLLHSRRENLRLSEQVAGLEKELNLNALLTEEKRRPSTNAGGSAEASKAPLPLPPPNKDREKELSSMIQNMEAKHVATVAELEGMIQSQNQLMEKLTSECHLLTQKLEDASTRHKEEIRELQTNLDYLSNKFTQQQANVVQSSSQDDQHQATAAPPHLSSTSGTPTRPRRRDDVPESPVNRSKPPSPITTPRKQQQQPPSPKQQTPTTPSRIQPPQTLTEEEFTPEEHQTPEKHQTPETEQYYPEKQYSPKQEPPQPQPQVEEYSQQQYAEQDYPMEQQYIPEQEYQDQQYPTEQYTDDNQQYTGDAQYTGDNQQYTDDNQQYTTGDQQYPTGDQQYTTEDQQYTAEQQYAPGEQQYTAEQQYPVDQQQYPVDQQQYPDQQQYLPEQYQEYDENQQYEQQYPQEYPMEQDYTAEQQYTEQYPDKPIEEENIAKQPVAKPAETK